MSIGLKIIAAAANDRPVDIKKLVEENLHSKISDILVEGYKIVASEQYGGLDEGRSRDRDLKGKSYEVDGKKMGGKEVSGANRKERKAWKQMGTKGAGPASSKVNHYRSKSGERFAKREN